MASIQYQKPIMQTNLNPPPNNHPQQNKHLPKTPQTCPKNPTINKYKS